MANRNGFTGSLVIDCAHNPLVSIRVGAGLDQAYERLFDSAVSEIQKDSAGVDSGVAAVVFGCMLLEARCHEYLPRIIEASGFTARAAEALSMALDRSPPVLKLRVIAAFEEDASVNDEPWLSAMGEVFHIRNSLIHFREKETEIATDVSFDVVKQHMLNMLADIPEAKLICELKTPHIERFIASIQEARSRLDAILRQFVKIETHEVSEETKH